MTRQERTPDLSILQDEINQDLCTIAVARVTKPDSECNELANNLQVITPPKAIAGFIESGEFRIADTPSDNHAGLWISYKNDAINQQKPEPRKVKSGEVFALKTQPEVLIVQFDTIPIDPDYKNLSNLTGKLVTKGYVVIDREFNIITE